MKVFSISDLHLDINNSKPMDIFGPVWHGHENKIAADWKEKVSAEDVVILAGDYSWAMKLEDVVPDFQFLADLPGTKILIRGNHDFWWSSYKKMQEFLEKHHFENIEFLKNNAFEIENKIITRNKRLVII